MAAIVVRRSEAPMPPPVRPVLLRELTASLMPPASNLRCGWKTAVVKKGGRAVCEQGQCVNSRRSFGPSQQDASLSLTGS